MSNIEFSLQSRRQKNDLVGLTLHIKNLTPEDVVKLAYYFELGDLPELGSLVVRGLHGVTPPADRPALPATIRSVITHEIRLLGEGDWAEALAQREAEAQP